jgi:hypothetical protein
MSDNDVTFHTLPIQDMAPRKMDRYSSRHTEMYTKAEMNLRMIRRAEIFLRLDVACRQKENNYMMHETAWSAQ